MAASKTVRFSELVEKGGRPEVHLSWTAPARDSALQGAVKQNRVVTIHQRFRGAQKDFGIVGLELGKDVQFLIFPKSLRAFAGRRVVGIKYELFEATTSVPSNGKKQRPQRKESGKGEHDDRVIAFPLAEAGAKPEKPPKAEKRATTRPEIQEPAKIEEEDPSEPGEEQDPTKAEMQKALDALSAGRIAEAKRRLRALLKT